jgi:hypothetical protein
MTKTRIVGLIMGVSFLGGCDLLEHRIEVAKHKYQRLQNFKKDYEQLRERVEKCEATQVLAVVQEQQRELGSCSQQLVAKDFQAAQTTCLQSRAPASSKKPKFTNTEDAIRGAIALLYSGSTQEAEHILSSLPKSEIRDYWLSIVYLANRDFEKAAGALDRFPAGLNP